MFFLPHTHILPTSFIKTKRYLRCISNIFVTNFLCDELSGDELSATNCPETNCPPLRAGGISLSLSDYLMTYQMC